MKTTTAIVVTALLAFTLTAGCASVHNQPVQQDTEPVEPPIAAEWENSPNQPDVAARRVIYEGLKLRPDDNDYTLIKGANMLTATGVADYRGDILIKGGEIAEISRSILPPEGASVIDAGGLWVTPGFIDAHSHSGGLEGLNDTIPGCSPGLRAIDGIDPADAGFEAARKSGVTTVCAGPVCREATGCVWPAIKTYGFAADDMLIREAAALYVSFSGSDAQTRMENASTVRQSLLDAQFYREELQAGRVPRNIALDHLSGVLDGSYPLKAYAPYAPEILTAIRIAKEFDADLTLDCPLESEAVIDKIAQSNFSVLLHVAPEGNDGPDVCAPSTPALLEQAGVKFALVTDGSGNSQGSLLASAQRAVSNGLTPECALLAVTRYPAEILGISDRIGTLEPGKDADLVLFEGLPFGVDSTIRLVMIDGVTVVASN